VCLLAGLFVEVGGLWAWLFVHILGGGGGGRGADSRQVE
jgi:hypothetical protein